MAPKLTVLASLIVLASPACARAAAPGWTETSPLRTARWGQTMTRLDDGRVLVAGGLTPDGVTSRAELYDPGSGAWSVTNPMGAARLFATATLLHDGRVLMAGGTDVPATCLEACYLGHALNSAELYDPVTGRWSDVPAMQTARSTHTATLLPDGKVLVAGGDVGGNVPTGTAEIFRGTGWAPAGRMWRPAEQHAAVLLGDGRVLVAGGTDDSLGPFGIAHTYDPATDSWHHVTDL